MGSVVNLVIGSEGFVGRSLCSYLRGVGEEVRQFDVKRGAHEDARFVTLPLDGVDRVYFLAWEVGGAKYLYSDDVQFGQLDWNLVLMQNVFAQLRTAGLPFLFVSSQLAQEVDTVYGVTKRLGEVWTGLLPAGVKVRLWNVYGGYEDSTVRSHVVADFVHQALDTKRIEMLTDGREIRQFVHVSDVCAGFHAAFGAGGPGPYDVASFEWIPVRQVADVIAELTGAEVVPGKRVGSSPVSANVGRVPGWLPLVSLRDGLGMMVEEFRRRKAVAR